MVDSVFTSIPCSREAVAKVCRRSWKWMCLHSACFRMEDSFFRTAAGSCGESSFIGEGNIHREVAAFLKVLRAPSTAAGRTTLRLEAIVQNVHGFVRNLGWLHMVGGVAWQQALVYCGFERMVESGVKPPLPQAGFDMVLQIIAIVIKGAGTEYRRRLLQARSAWVRP